ncbi:MAG: DNA primase [Clostridia bacterium]|nr:DNA primase [Clostridia bacterium]MDD4047659.1 DNA primase [Clostridia bacterium]
MPGQIPQDFIDNLRSRVDIIEIIKEYVPLKKQGQNYSGLCPFHSEKTPSFVVSPNKQIFHCFGCGKGGNVYSFLMEKEGISFPDAVNHVARHCGIAIPQEDISPEKARKDLLLEKYYSINELAASFFQRNIYEDNGLDAFQYLKQRGLNEEIMAKFILGYSFNSWDALSCYMLEKGVTEEELIKLGLANKGQKGNLYDRFRNRVMFPILNEKSKIVGFGGRVLDDSQPKYLNSPETPLFNKGRHLYGMNLAKSTIRSKEQVVLMEGYMDVIAAHQYGINQAVGTLGTALTKEQGKLLMKYTYNAVICFDADIAGQEATTRGLDVLQQLGIRVSVMSIPGAKDPDEVLRIKGKDNFNEIIYKASSLFEYKLKNLMQKYNKDSVQGKVQIIQKIMGDMSKVQSPVERQGYIQLMSEQLAFPESAIHAEIRKFRNEMVGNRNEERKTVEINRGRKNTAVDKAQRVLIRLLLDIPEIMDEVEKHGGKILFSNKLYKEIYQKNYLLCKAGHNIKAEDLISHLEDVETRDMLAEIFVENDLSHDWEKAYEDCITTLEIELVKEKITELKALMIQYEKIGDVTKSLEVMTEIQELIRDRHRLVSTLGKGGNILES